MALRATPDNESLGLPLTHHMFAFLALHEESATCEWLSRQRIAKVTETRTEFIAESSEFHAPCVLARSGVASTLLVQSVAIFARGTVEEK